MVLGGRYELVRLIARGGQAEVHEAVDRMTGARLALKLLLAAHARERATIERLRREMLLAMRITHRNVARLFAFDTTRDENERELPFITMELLPGQTLHERLQERGPLSTAEGLPIVEQIAEGLEAAHGQNVIHRDLKPGNVILVTEGAGERVVVTDFGLARPIESEDLASLTATGETVGTPLYMAPEQLRGAVLTRAVDVYALGVLMFELVTGRLPFGENPSLAAQLEKLLEPAPPARRFAPKLDAAWNRTIARCLDISPAKRFASALEVIAGLHADGKSASPNGRILGRLRRPTGRP